MDLPPPPTDARPTEDRSGWQARARSGPKRLPVLLILAAIAILLFVPYLVHRARAPGPGTPPAPPPTVSVVVPAQKSMAREVHAIGTIFARKDMPVGVVGEGGMITRIRAEAGQWVAKGAILADIDSAVQQAQLQQLQAAVRQADADRKLADGELQRALQLQDRGFISKADIERKTAARDAAAAHVAVVAAEVREMERRIARLSIRAPEAGLVLERNVETGQIVSPQNGMLYRIAAGGQMELRANVAEQDMAGLAVGQQVQVTPTGSGREYSGRIWLLGPAIDPATRQGLVRIDLPPAPGIRAGGFASATIRGAATLHPVLPRSAVLADRDGRFVFLVDEEARVHRVPVIVGAETADGIAILAGLGGHERIVRSAGAFLEPGEKITPIAAPEAPVAAPGASG